MADPVRRTSVACCACYFYFVHVCVFMTHAHVFHEHHFFACNGLKVLHSCGKPLRSSRLEVLHSCGKPLRSSRYFCVTSTLAIVDRILCALAFRIVNSCTVAILHSVLECRPQACAVFFVPIIFSLIGVTAVA